MSNVLNMADVHRIKKNADVSDGIIFEGWNPSPVLLVARSLELLNVNDV